MQLWLFDGTPKFSLQWSALPAPMGLYSYGLYSYGLHIYGLYSYGLYSYGP